MLLHTFPISASFLFQPSQSESKNIQSFFTVYSIEKAYAHVRIFPQHLPLLLLPPKSAIQTKFNEKVQFKYIFFNISKLQLVVPHYSSEMDVAAEITQFLNICVVSANDILIK